MRHSLGPKLVVLQCPFAFLDGEATCAWEDPLVALTETDAAVTVHGGGDFWELDVELEGSAMAIAIVGLEFSGFSHDGC